METVEEIQTKANRLESEYNKLKQDFKNYIETSQKNEQHKKQEMIVNQSKKLLVVADSLDRIAGFDKNSSCDTVNDYSENLQKNIGAIYNQMLSASDLVAIYPAKGDGFDEQKHIAIGLEYGIAYPDNSIFRVIRKGYTLENNVVRPAEVIVMKTPVDKKIIKPGLWTRLLRWTRPTKYHFSDINQKINEIEQRQKDYLSKLEVDTQMLRDTIHELSKKIERTEEVGTQQEEMTGKIAADMQTLRDTIHELNTKSERTEEVGTQQEEMTGKIAADMQTLRDTIHELDKRTERIEEVGAQQEGMTGKTALDMESLRQPLHETEEMVVQTDEFECVSEDDIEELTPGMGSLIDQVRELSEKVVQTYEFEHSTQHDIEKTTPDTESQSYNNQENASLNFNLHLPEIYQVVPDIQQEKAEENEPTPLLHEEEADSSPDSYTDESNKNDENRNDSNRIGVNNAG